MFKDRLLTNTQLSRYVVFTLLFQMGMAISLASMPIYFKHENAIPAYGVAYAVMAITGAFSFIYGMVVDRIGFAKALLFGVLLYAVALSMRVFTHPVIAIVTAVMAGVGASTAILANRSWVLQMVEDDTSNTTELTAIRSMVVNVGMLLGAGIVSLAVYLFGVVYFWLLLLAGGFVFGSALLVYQNYQSTKKTTPTNHIKETLPIKNILTIPVCLFILANVVVGIYTGLFKPYVILMLIDYGASESKSIFIHLLTTVVSIVSGFFILKYNHILKNIPFMGFMMSMIGLALVFVMMSIGLSYQLGFWVLVIDVFARSLFLSLSGVFEEVLEYELLDKSTLAMTLGFTQTAFLAGDAIGSLITSLWVVPQGRDDYVQICVFCAVLVLIQAVVMLIVRGLACTQR